MTHLINFSPQFAPLVREGTKRQTIRRKRRRPIKVGDTLRLYTGLRIKKGGLLREAVCTAVHEIEWLEPTWLFIDGSPLDEQQLIEFAPLDGFIDFAEMLEWFEARYVFPFEGVVIRW